MTQRAGGASRKTRGRRAVAAPAAVTRPADLVDEPALLSDLRGLVQSARERIAAAAFATQSLLCWHLGRRLLRENLQGKRAENGKQILVTVSRALAAEYGRAFSDAELARMVQFAHPPVLEMYRRLCRHDGDIGPAAAADDVRAHRERWDSDQSGESA